MNLNIVKNARSNGANFLSAISLAIEANKEGMWQWQEKATGALFAKKWQEAGFMLEAKIAVSNSAASWLGTFSKKHRPGAVAHGDGWFHPAITAKEHFSELVEVGTPEDVAAEKAEQYVLSDYQRAVSFGRDWVVYRVSVDAYRAGVLVGQAEIDGVDGHMTGGRPSCEFDEFVEQLVPDAKKSAIFTLQTKFSQRRAA
jgi:hypothetical protein